MFSRNIGAISAAEQDVLLSKKVFVAGCGGLGGYAAEFLVRAGIGKIVVCDKDVFDITNLNRQRFSDIYKIGADKASTVKEKLLDINPSAEITAQSVAITEENIEYLLDGCDLAIDALDNISTRLILEKGAKNTGVPLIFGAVGEWCGQVSAVYPGDDTISMVYKNSAEQAAPSVTVMTAAVIAGYQAAEAVKVLLGRPSLRKKLLVADLEDYSIDILMLK